jgi:hypothetical protein
MKKKHKKRIKVLFKTVCTLIKQLDENEINTDGALNKLSERISRIEPSPLFNDNK